MTILIEPLKLLFTGVPGAASTSVEQALEKLPNAVWIAPKHTTVDRLIEDGTISCEARKELNTVCIVRNPYDHVHAEWFRSRTRWILEIDDPTTVGSWSEEKRKQIKFSAAMDFPTFVRAYYGSAFLSGKQMYLYKRYTEFATNIFKFEKLDEFAIWMKCLSGEDIFIETANASPGRMDYWRDYDHGARQIISSVFQPEIEQFTYNF